MKTKWHLPYFNDMFFCFSCSEEWIGGKQGVMDSKWVKVHRHWKTSNNEEQIKGFSLEQVNIKESCTDASFVKYCDQGHTISGINPIHNCKQIAF